MRFELKNAPKTLKKSKNKKTEFFQNYKLYLLSVYRKSIQCHQNVDRHSESYDFDFSSFWTIFVSPGTQIHGFYEVRVKNMLQKH